MATIGLRDLFVSIITEDADTGEETYATPVRLAKAIKADISVTKAEAVLYADDAVDETIAEFTNGTVTLSANDLTPENQALILGQTLDSDDILYAGSDDNPPYLAIGFRAKKPSGQFLYMWLLKARFGVPSESYETKGQSINFHTPEIVATFITRRLDNMWKAQMVAEPDDKAAEEWFDEAPVPAA